MSSWGAKISMQTHKIMKVLIFPSLQCTLRQLDKNSHVKNNKLISILTFEDIKADTITKPISKKDLLMTTSPL